MVANTFDMLLLNELQTFFPGESHMKDSSLPFLNQLTLNTKQNEKTITHVRYEPETPNSAFRVFPDQHPERIRPEVF